LDILRILYAQRRARQQGIVARGSTPDRSQVGPEVGRSESVELAG